MEFYIMVEYLEDSVPPFQLSLKRLLTCSSSQPEFKTQVQYKAPHTDW